MTTPDAMLSLSDVVSGYGKMTILNGEHATTVDSVDGTKIASGDLFAATGWQLKPEGLCQGDVCVPVRDRSQLVIGDSIDLDAFAGALRRPIVIDAGAGVAALGVSAGEVTDTLRDRVAPDFTLANIDGQEFTMSKIGRKKKVLVVWSSW